MEHFLDKIKKATKEVKKFYYDTANKSNNFGRDLLLINLSQPLQILENNFDSDNDYENHLINYYKFILRNKRDLTLDGIQYWLIRSAIASISKYTNPSIDSLMTQFYSSGYNNLIEQFDNTLNTRVLKRKEIVTAFKNLEGKTRSDIGFTGDKKHVEKCKVIMDKTLSSLEIKMQRFDKLNIEQIFDLFGFEIIEIMINDIKEKNTLPNTL